MELKINLYSGAGNNFVILDGRLGIPDIDIPSLCRQYSTDGLMLLKESEGFDFEMDYYNSDGSSGMMCGNGGRCIVAFARDMGIEPSSDGTYRFLAPDGEHCASILPNGEVRLKMIDVKEFHRALDGGWFVDTGTRHYVKFVEDIEAIDINSLGRHYRQHPDFAPLGVNANFVERLSDSSFKIRTFEKGVEAETLACGTGITASAIACWLDKKSGTERMKYQVRARINDLQVEFTPGNGIFTEVYLTGPAHKYL